MEVSKDITEKVQDKESNVEFQYDWHIWHVIRLYKITSLDEEKAWI